MSRRSRAAGQWLNWIIDESLSLRWAGFKLNPAYIELQLIVLPASPSPALQVFFHHFSTSVTFHLHQSVFFLLFTPTATYLLHLYLSTLFLPSIYLAFSCCPSHSLPLAHVIYGSIRPSLFLSLESDGVFAHTKKTLSQLLVHVSVSCPPFSHFSYFLPPSQSNFLPSPSLGVSPQAANGE